MVVAAARADVDRGTGRPRERLERVLDELERQASDAVPAEGQVDDGVRATADISSLRLADIAFDSRTLRVIAVAQGAITVSITKLPGL